MKSFRVGFDNETIYKITKWAMREIRDSHPKGHPVAEAAKLIIEYLS